MTASVTVSPKYASAVFLILPRIKADISAGLYFLSLILMRTSPLDAPSSWYGRTLTSPWTSADLNLRPISRFTPKTVFSGLVMACRLATCPTRRSPLSETATMEGVVLPPSGLVMTLASPPSMTATQELVVPKSIPIILLIFLNLPKVIFNLFLLFYKYDHYLESSG